MTILLKLCKYFYPYLNVFTVKISAYYSWNVCEYFLHKIILV